MPETGDSDTPRSHDPDHHDDDLIGFASPASLQGRNREPVPPVAPEPTPSAEAEDDLFEPKPEPVFAPPPRAAAPDPEPAVTPQWARETPVSAQPTGSFARRGEQPSPVDGAMGIYSVYALILFAVPTLGVSALIALVAVTGRPGPQGEVAASHFIFQQRTLWAGAVVALLGGILIAVGLGVFVLFMLAVWLILRGAGGVMKLKAGQPIARPRAWLF